MNEREVDDGRYNLDEMEVREDTHRVGNWVRDVLEHQPKPQGGLPY